MLAVINYNSIACGTPADSSKAAQEKTRHWKKFMDNLDWNTLTRKADAMKDPLSVIRGLGVIPLRSRK